jgi:transposase InsO family protein
VVTADQRRQAVCFLQERFGVSERRACRVLGQQRSTQRQPPKKATEEEGRLVARMLELVRQRPRFGYRRICVLLRREGWRVNRKRIYRLWRQQGLKVPRKQRKKRRLGSSANSCVRRPAEHKDHVWAWDFLHDRTRVDERGNASLRPRPGSRSPCAAGTCAPRGSRPRG